MLELTDKTNHTSLASCQMCIITPQRHKIVISFNTLISNIFLNWHFFLKKNIAVISASFLPYFLFFWHTSFWHAHIIQYPIMTHSKRNICKIIIIKKHSFCLWLLATESYQKKQAYKALTKRHQTHITSIHSFTQSRKTTHQKRLKKGHVLSHLCAGFWLCLSVAL